MNKQGSKSYLQRDSQSLSDFRHNERDIINQNLSSRQPFNSITNLHQLSVPKRLPSSSHRDQFSHMSTPLKKSITQKPMSSSKSDIEDHHRFYSIQTLSQTPNLKHGKRKTQTQTTFSQLKNPNKKTKLYLFETPKEGSNSSKNKRKIEQGQNQEDQNFSKYQTRKLKASGSNSSKKSKSCVKNEMMTEEE